MPFNEIYWLDGWNGKAHSGYFYRNNLFEAIKKFEKEWGKKIVGIRIEDGWNIEFICEEDNDDKQTENQEGDNRQVEQPMLQEA